MVKKLFPFLWRDYKKELSLSIFSSFMETALQLLIPLVMANIIDLGILQKNSPYIVKLGFLMIFMAALALAFGMGSARYSSLVGQGTGTNLRAAQFQRIQELSFRDMDRFSEGSLITRLTLDITAVQRAITMGLRMLVRAPMMILVALILAVMISPGLSVVFLAAIPLLLAFVLLLLKFIAPRFTQLQESMDGLNTVVQENISGIRVVKSFGREEEEIQKYDRINRDLQNITQKAFHILVIAFPAVQLIIFGTTLAILWLGGSEVYAGRLEIGKLATFLSYVMQILFSVIMVAMMLILLSRSEASGKRILEVLDTPAEFQEKTWIEGLYPKDGSVEFRGVFFRYHEDSENDVLQDISFRISSGQTLGIIGGTGSGKSTLVQLLPRLYHIRQGEIFLGGCPIQSYDPVLLREGVSMVLQKNTLFQGSIAENLRWGNPQASLQEMEEACHVAGAHEFISGFPEGYDKKLEQEGSNLSGGQRQRLCIARSLLARPKVLILDDSTSAVDTATEKAIRKGLSSQLPGMTKIIISQRIASVQEADKILVLEHGRICAEGTHLELLSSSETYRSIYQSQVWGGAE